MQVTVFSFFVALVWSTTIALLQYVFIKKRYFVRVFGISSILLLNLFPIIRILLPVEFGFTKVVKNVFFWNKLYEYLCIDKISIFSKSLTRFSFLMFICFAGMVMFSALFALRYIRAVIKIEKLDFICNEHEKEILARVIQTTNKPLKIKLFIVPNVESPIAMGILKKKIILPSQDYSEDELFFILLHEVTHFLKHDLFLKILVQVLCCIFWWNPIVYLLRKELEQVLEIKCDLAVVENMDKEKKIDYLSAIVHIVKRQGSHLKKYGFEVASLFGSNQEEHLIERFKIVSDDKGNAKSKFAKLVYLIGVVGTVFVSYLFILQPVYTAPKEEIVTEEDVYDIEPENTVIVEHINGKYLLIHESGYQQLISKEIAEELIAKGFKIRQGG